MTLIPVLILFVFLAVCVALGLKIVKEHEQGLVARLGKHLGVVEPGLNLIVPFVDHMQVVDLREVEVWERIEPAATGRIRIGDEEWDARTNDAVAIGPGTPIRIVSVEGPVFVVTAAR